MTGETGVAWENRQSPNLAERGGEQERVPLLHRQKRPQGRPGILAPQSSEAKASWALGEGKGSTHPHQLRAAPDPADVLWGRGGLPPTFRRAVGLDLTELKLLLCFPQLLFGLLQPLLELELLALKGKRRLLL